MKIINSDREFNRKSMDQIYLLIGQYVEATQMIESMLQGYLIFEDMIRNYDQNTQTINGLDFESYFSINQDKLIKEISKKSTMTLGTAAHSTFSNKEASVELARSIFKVTRERNKIIHEYFKTPDFYIHWDNKDYLNNQINFLTTKVNEAREVCDKLRVLWGFKLWEDRWDKSLGDHQPINER